MSRVLNDVSEYLSKLGSEKVTERKQGASKLELLLKEKETLNVLDYYSERKSASSQRNITWDLVVGKVSKFVARELEQKSVSEAKIKDAGNLYQFVIRVAEKQFLEYYCKLFSCSTASDQMIQYATVIHDLLSMADSLPDVSVDKLFEFYEEVFLRLRFDKSSNSLEYLIKGFIKFLNITVMDWQYRIYGLLEKVFQSFQNYFQLSFKFTNQSLRVDLCEVFIIMMKLKTRLSELDHPFEETWSNFENWSNKCRSLYGISETGISLLDNEVFATRSLLIFLPTSNKDQSKFYQFVATLMIQMENVFSDSKFGENDVEEVASCSKRRKLNEDSALQTILQKIVASPNKLSIKAWLDVILVLVHRKEDWKIKFLDYDKIYATFQNILPAINRDENVTLVQKIMIAILKQLPSLGSQSKSCRVVWEHAIKCIRAKNNCDLAYLLLQKLWECGFHDSKVHLYRLFTDDIALVSENSITFLEVLMRTGYFPEKENYQFIIEYTEDHTENYPLRKQLFEWLIPKKGESSNKYHLSSLSEWILLQNLSALLVSLLSVSPVETISLISKCPQNGKLDSAPLKTYKTIAPLEQYFMQKLEIMCNEIISDTTKKPNSPEDLFWMLEIAGRLLSFMVHLITNTKYVSCSQQLKNKMGTMAQGIFKRLILLLKNVIKTDHPMKTKSLCNCMDTLQGLALTDIFEKYLIPNTVLEIIESFMMLQNDSNGESDFSSFNLSSNTNDSLNSSEAADEFMEFDQCSPAEEESPTNSLDDHPLNGYQSDEKKIRLAACKIIALFLFSEAPADENKEKRVHFLHMMKEKIKQKELQLLMVLSILDIIVTHNFSLHPEEVYVILSCIKSIFATYHNDQNICKTVLQRVTFLIEQIKNHPQNEREVEQSKLLLVKLLGVFCARRKQKYCPSIRQCLVQIVAAICKINDETGMWKLEIKDQGQDDSSLVAASTMLLQLMLDESISVRTEAIKSFSVIFKNKSKVEQLKVFSHIKNIIKNFRRPEIETLANRDQWRNQEEMIVSLLKETICSSFVIDKEALWLLVDFAYAGILQTKRVFLVICDISKQLGYESVTSYLDTRTDYIFKYFFEKGYKLKKFPYETLHSSPEKFFSLYYKSLVPQILLNNQHECIKDIAKILKMDVQKMLINCLPHIVLYTFPTYCNHLHKKQVDEDGKALLRCLQDYQKMLTHEVFNEALESQFAEIFGKLFLNIYDGGKEQCIAVKYYRANDHFSFYPFLTSEQVGTVLTSIANCYADTKTVENILLKKPDCIALTLTLLSSYVSKASLYSEKFNFMCSYYCYVVLLLKKLKTLHQTGNYIMREILLRLMYFLEDDCNEEENFRISMICFDLLEFILNMAIQFPCIIEEISKLIYFIVLKLTDFLKENNTKSEHSKKVLSLLILQLPELEGAEDIRRSISSLDFFLDDLNLQELNQKLLLLKQDQNPAFEKEEIERILNNLDLRIIAPEYRQLTSLKQHLIENRSSTEINSNIAKLSTVVLQYCTSKDNTMKTLAVECLGLIGPCILPARFDNEQISLQDTLTANHNFTLIDALVEECQAKSCTTSTAAVHCLLQTLNVISSKNLMQLKFLSSFSYIAPYVKTRRKKAVSQEEQGSLSPERLYDTLLQTDMFLQHETSSKEWITAFVEKIVKIIEDPFYNSLLPICKVSINFSKKCLVYLLESVLSEHPEFKTVIENVLDELISSCVEHMKSSSAAPGKDMFEKMSVLVNMVLYLWKVQDRQPSHKNYTCWGSRFHLNINYLNLAELTNTCGEIYAATLFLEIYLDPFVKELSKNDETDSESQVSKHYSANLEGTIIGTKDLSHKDKRKWQKLCFDVYNKVGGTDAVYGLDTSFLSFDKKRLHGYKLEQHYAKALLTNDVVGSSNETCMIKDLLSSGMNSTAYLCSKGLGGGDITCLTELQYEAAWKTSKWEGIGDNIPASGNHGYHSNIHHSLSAIRSNDNNLFQKYVEDLKISIADEISDNLINFSDINGTLKKCFTVHHLEATGYLVLRGDQPNHELFKLGNYYQEHDEALFVSAQALKIGHSLGTARKESMADLLVNHLEKYFKFAFFSKNYQTCERIMHEIHELESSGLTTGAKWKIEEARLYWARQEKNNAIYVLKNLLNELENNFDDDLGVYPQVLSLYGHWLGEIKSNNPTFIMEEYLEPVMYNSNKADEITLYWIIPTGQGRVINVDKAIEVMEGESYSGSSSPLKAYHSLAKYADEQYQSLLDYMKSPVFENREKVILKNKEDLTRYQQQTNKSADTVVKRYYYNLKKQCEADEKELEQLVTNKKDFLLKAAKYYSKCLELDNRYDMKILRLCSLWFRNCSYKELANELKEHFSRIKSEKFLLIMYQLAARLGTDMTKEYLFFKETLEEVIVRCVQDHPHHSLFILLALCNADLDQRITKAGKGGKLSVSRRSKCDDHRIDKGRIESAEKVLEQIRQHRMKLVQSAEQLAHSYVELAYWDVTHLKKEKGPFQIPETTKIRKLQELTSVAVPTIEVKIDPKCEYNDIVYISRFDHTFNLAGGVNLPKIISCIGSDGKKRKQLVKGKDDLRQDAVMQQVFGVVNKLLQSDSETQSRELKMRTYKVVPLSQNSGLLQWCEGTIPLGNYLVNGQDGVHGAHPRYYPKGWTARECREKITNAKSENGPKSKLSVYKEIERNFAPVFRHFFLEKYKEPSSWFARKQCYTKSTAVASIVGYIVGLGDRHCQNILIDCQTAEMVHIDLGVAFEQGKLLPTPETIPFRLTRDVVDGMGVFAIEGVFRRSCEKTLDVLKDSKEALITIVEVLLYDPLSQWNISPEKARKLQKSVPKNDSGITQIFLPTQREELERPKDTNDKNKAAERVLIRLEQKLSGYEGHSYLATEGQVNLLIQEARSVDNLSKLFPGWQPWL